VPQIHSETHERHACIEQMQSCGRGGDQVDGVKLEIATRL